MQVFTKNYIPKSVSSLNDDLNMVMYKMNGSDKLCSAKEFPTQNVNLNRVEKVFKLVEVEISEIEICQKNKDFQTSKKINLTIPNQKVPTLTINREIITMGGTVQDTIRKIITSLENQIL
ncbi:hypothetical protein Hanom_Chr10g00916151 [Helianthus anomalus]